MELQETAKEKVHKPAIEPRNEPARVRVVRLVYGLLAAAYLVCVVLQVLFAGMGIFVESGDLELHRVFANYFEFGSVALFLLSWAGRIRGGMRWLPLALFVLTSLQHMTVRTFTGMLPALHTVDALFLFGISLRLTKQSWGWLLIKRGVSDK